MSIVKIGDKKQLEQLQAKITLRLGHRPTQQEILDLCVKLGLTYFDNLVQLLENLPTLDEEKVQRILAHRTSLKDILYVSEDDHLSEEDSDIYR
jgi:ERCC4-type nuclease